LGFLLPSAPEYPATARPPAPLLEGLLGAPEASQGDEEGVIPGSDWIVVAVFAMGVAEDDDEWE